MTAFAIFGSATSTSLTSRGKSMITDLPTPSARKRTLADPTVATGAATLSSLASTGVKAGLSVSAATAENDRARTRKVRIAG
jgi:hypothetical protein